jgi:ribosomal protein S18 acetylase RimI-like enzyme
MIEFHSDPPLPARPVVGTFSQALTMRDGDQTLGLARWHCPADAEAGIVQILDLNISAKHQRTGHGKRLLQAVLEQAGELQRRRKAKLRRVWIGVEQKSQVIGRAFLTSAGFHHVGTVSGLYRDQDLMIYVKSLD